MEVERQLVGGPRDGHVDSGIAYPRIKTVEREGVATYCRGRLIEGEPAIYTFHSIKPHPAPQPLI